MTARAERTLGPGCGGRLPLVKRSAATQCRECHVAASEEIGVIRHNQLAKSACDGGWGQHFSWLSGRRSYDGMLTYWNQAGGRSKTASTRRHAREYQCGRGVEAAT